MAHRQRGRRAFAKSREVTRSLSRCRLVTRSQAGQSAVLVAIVLPALMALLLTAVEVHERYLERALVEDALQQATRSAAQSFEYARFAENQYRFVVEGGAPAKQGCATAPAGSARAIGCAVLIANLRGVPGLQETPEQTAERVTWTIYRGDGTGTCTFPNGRPPVTSAAPMVCATLQPVMAGFGLIGGAWTPQIDAADVLDRSQ